MLEKLRDNSRSLGTYLIIGAITVVFVVFFGQGSLGFTEVLGGVPAYAAKVNGETISFADFQKRYGSMIAAYRQQSGGQFDEAMAEQLGLKDTALDQLIDRHLLVEMARKNGIAVSDAEVAEVVKSYTDFHKDGAFDFATYKSVLGANGMKPEQFENEVRTGLLAEKMLTQVRYAAKASDAEVEAAFRKDNDKANLAFVRFTPQMFSKQARPSDAEVSAWLASDEGKETVAKEYEAKKFRFEKPKRVKAQHILVKVAEDAPADEVAAAEAKLREAKKKIEEGADFGELARQISEDEGTKDKGGDLGFFGPGAMAKPFEDAAMALGVGEVSDIVRTRFGVHLIKVNEIEEPQTKTLEQAGPEIATELLQARKARELAKAKAEETLAKVQAGAQLAELFPAAAKDAPSAPGNDPATDETGLFNVQSEYVPRIGVNAEIAAAARGAEAGAVLPRAYEAGGAWVVAQVKERVHPDMAEFEKNADTYRRRVQAQKEAALVDAFTRGLRKGAKVEKNPMIFADAEG